MYRNLQVVLGALASRAYQQAFLEEPGERDTATLASFASTDQTSPMAPSESFANTSVPSTIAPVAAQPSLTPVNASSLLDDVHASAGTDQLVINENDMVNTVTAARATTSAPSREEIELMVHAWVTPWSDQDVDEYLGYYGHHFTPSRGLSYTSWKAQRRQRIATPTFIEVAVRDVDIAFLSPDRSNARFTQEYRSNILKSSVVKMLELARNNGHWKIVQEVVQR